jgi:RNA 2',3'-cyclic 3'-phosphodiesterase
MADVRAFIAVELPEPVLGLLERAQASLAQAVPRGPVRWVRPEGIHLTLKFLGNVAENKIGAIAASMDVLATGERRLVLETGGLGYFPPRGTLRVLWLGVSGQVSALSMLQRRVDQALTAHGFAPESRAFSPHLTLGRVREGASQEEQRAIAAALNRMRPEEPLPILVEGVTLFESQLRPGGAVYAALHHASFPSSASASGN